ncbi:MAG: Gfo/Idh/MocA family protein [Candidatus Methylacidiphilales bacterium]|nr:Gfo/Idh/MocA family oxidoreductase [Candidatus Methylacidiphilales bacterium]
MKFVRFGIVGLGGMGSNHARQIDAGNIPRATLTAVCDVAPNLAERYPGKKVYSDSAEMIRSGEIDAILIATPHYSHTTIGIDALEQGLHVLVEKPISVHKADCERLIGAAQKVGANTEAGKQVFAAMFNQRTNQNHRKLRQMIIDGELGEIRRINWIITDWFRTYAYYASGGWRATWAGEGGGVLLNQCPHNLDLFQWIFGMPQKVRAFCKIGRYHDIEVEDDVTAYMEYANGTNAVFITSTGEAPGTNRLEVTAERGRVIVDNTGISFQRNEIPMTEFSKTTKSGFDRPQTWDIKVPNATGGGGQHNEIIGNFVDAILDGKNLIAPAEEGIHSVELANSMIYSSFTDSTVSLPLSSADYEAFLKKKIEESTFEKKTVTQPSGTPDDFAKSFGR